uniref:Uncharacterized protein n=1 Tax=Arundo donax TaxID=35708 RepID=A0A0A9EI99_ARUDO
MTTSSSATSRSCSGAGAAIVAVTGSAVAISWKGSSMRGVECRTGQWKHGMVAGYLGRRF